MAPAQKPRSRRDDFLFWWPVLARIAGVVGAIAEGAASLATHQNADAGILGFCGLLVAVPIIFSTQEKKNGRR